MGEAIREITVLLAVLLPWCYLGGRMWLEKRSDDEDAEAHRERRAAYEARIERLFGMLVPVALQVFSKTTPREWVPVEGCPCPACAETRKEPS